MTFVFIFLLFAAHLGVPARGDFLSSCPALCNCKWSNGKRMADCVDKSLTTIPMFQTSTDDGIQVLSMDGNYIKELGKDAFASAGLINLQKISMKNCQIQRIHEDAFSKLNILTEVNLEGNNLTKIPQKTFDGNNRLQTIILARNQLEYLKEYQFPPLPNLKKIDLSRTGLREMSQKAFNNLAQSVEEIDLSGNQLKSIVETTFLPLPSLKTLRLHDNPWVCDCQLKSFRDYAVHRNLNNPEPKCFEPDRLADKTWTDVKSLEFACKPTIKVYNRRVYAQSGWNVTLTCHITGNPVPSTRWVLAGRVIHDNAAPLHSNSLAQQYILQEVALGPGGIERNISLTITNVKSADQGDYNCVAINQGGMAEKNITLTFAHPNTWPGNKIKNN
ncbi:leucine-rich repeat-containing protein 24 [Eurytemora carolleeae]|uniref:leucine-rich repeat-containing protein 24 n=1 Tax=Eurytemora carolleeae TaxID=1294199 RepID=UPI000C75EC25|nr:leucine-rich repeat-containing protein 24 [Eurytemora carolleeae]|eukprot:XP_023330609.1 leucine-rich repeat-containing protein 24-like [Eurytemora affinis]